MTRQKIRRPPAPQANRLLFRADIDPDPDPGHGRSRSRSRPRKVEARTGGAPADALIVVAVRQTVLFPEIVFPITINRNLSVAGGAGGDPRAAPGAGAAAEGPGHRRAGAGRHAQGGRGRQYPALRHRAGRLQPHHLPGRAALPHHRVRLRLPLSGRPRPAPAGAADLQFGHRGALPAVARAVAGSDLVKAAGACRSCGWRSKACSRRRRWPIWPPPTWTSPRPRSRRSWRRSTCRRGSTRSRACWPTGWRC